MMDGSTMRLMDIESRLPPGFRFHPSDQELVCYYLRDKVMAASSSSQHHQLIVSSPPLLTMVEVDLHVSEPWDLPVAAKLGDKQEWYFFSSRDRKYATGSRTNRATPQGYWKATGKDKMIHEHEHGGMIMGMRKTLVFYLGRAPNGRKSDWVMHEFRLVTSTSTSTSHAATPPTIIMEEDWVLCRVFHKGKGEAGHGGRSDDNLVDMVMITSPPAADNNLDGGQLLFPPTPTTGLLVMGGQDYYDPATIQQAAAADDDGFVKVSRDDADVASSGHMMEDMVVGFGENCFQREMEMLLLQQDGNYFPCM
ncbi:hypothetical protein PR202_gb18312 [Eleusine coracana subsp. coracana]|uniref:NAC domain-containing protein n=1 Tax=Eleusine coracana subsp. coracana TaxID=191504 RepID=A0AAV5F5X3_ELECO|nr:hypothetical protein QOZ80_3BG0297270 [Eleusine coracana subsp. coracana]GJN30038.1 hypothetical protein PR202_gb18312 [Eleusine coracana subsp. coracana]